MKVILYGASGMIGSRILDELVSRRHRVIAVTRHPANFARHDVESRTGDVLDSAGVAKAVAGADAVISAYAPPVEAAQQLVDATRSLLEALKEARRRRFLMVGGAGNLEVAPGVPLVDTPHFPPQWLSHGRAHKAALFLLRHSDLDWTSVSPPALIEPGKRTGNFRLSGHTFIADESGRNSISAEDYAVALVDELEQPRHIRQLVGVLY